MADSGDPIHDSKTLPVSEVIQGMAAENLKMRRELDLSKEDRERLQTIIGNLGAELNTAIKERDDLKPKEGRVRLEKGGDRMLTDNTKIWPAWKIFIAFIALIAGGVLCISVMTALFSFTGAMVRKTNETMDQVNRERDALEVKLEKTNETIVQLTKEKDALTATFKKEKDALAAKLNQEKVTLLAELEKVKNRLAEAVLPVKPVIAPAVPSTTNISTDAYSHLQTIEKPEDVLEKNNRKIGNWSLVFWIGLSVFIASVFVVMLSGFDFDPHAGIVIMLSWLGIILSSIGFGMRVSEFTTSYPKADDFATFPAGVIDGISSKNCPIGYCQVTIIQNSKSLKIYVPSGLRGSLTVGIEVPNYQLLKEGTFHDLKALPDGKVLHKSSTVKKVEVASNIRQLTDQTLLIGGIQDYYQIYLYPSDAPEILIRGWVPKGIYDQLVPGMVIKKTAVQKAEAKGDYY